jgi:hypothetical protein
MKTLDARLTHLENRAPPAEPLEFQWCFVGNVDRQSGCRLFAWNTAGIEANPAIGMPECARLPGEDLSGLISRALEAATNRPPASEAIHIGLYGTD